MTKKYTYVPIKWRAVFAESTFIGASILLAFWLQDWGENKDIEQRTQIALCNIKSELKFNRVLLKNDYIPRQKGMSMLSNATLAQLKAQPQTKIKLDKLKEMLFGEPLRYSAWTVAGESGYLVYANFELATEIGALIHYQEDQYKTYIDNVNWEFSNFSLPTNKKSIENFVIISDSINELMTQTRYLEVKYDTIFQREDFRTLECA